MHCALRLHELGERLRRAGLALELVLVGRDLERVGWMCACRTIETTFALDAQFGTFSVAWKPSRDVFSRWITPFGGSAPGRKTSIAVMNGSAK